VHRQIINSSFIYLSASLMQALMQFCLLPLHTHYLAQSDYGVLATVMGSAALLSFIFNIGLHGAAQRFSGDYQQHIHAQRQLWGSVLVLSIGSCVVIGTLTYLFLLALPVNIFPNIANIPYLGYAVLNALAMGVVFVGGELLRMQKQPQRYALVFISMYLSNIPLNYIFVVLLHWQLNGALLSFSLMPWIGALVLFLSNKDTLVWRADTKLMAELARYAFKLLPHFIFTVLNTVADRLLVTILLGKQFTGFYYAGSMLASFMPMLVSAIGFSARPHIYSRFKLHTAQAFKEVKQISIAAVLVIGMVGSNIALWSDEVLQLLTTQAYHSAWIVTVLLVLRYMLQGLVVFLICNILYNKQKTQWLVSVSGLSLCLLVFSAVSLAKSFGVIGMAMAALMTSCFYLLISYLLSRQVFAMRWPIVQMLGAIFLFFVPACLLLMACHFINPLWWWVLGSKFLFSLCSAILLVVCVSVEMNISLSKIVSTWRNKSQVEAAA